MPNKFGSDWTEQKLGVISDYSFAWSKIMHFKKKDFGWNCRYIDAFSGTGSYEPKTTAHDEKELGGLLFTSSETDEEKIEIRKGSARLALEVDPKFDRIDLIEKNPKFAQSLRDLAGDELNHRVHVHCEDANVALTRICGELTRKDRALIFIDPFGCQVWWETLEAVAKCEVADVFYLIPTMGINRQISGPGKEIPQKTADRLDRTLGTSDWREVFYTTEISVNLFGEASKSTRTAGPNRVEEFFLDQLNTIFPAVHKDCLRLKNRRNGHMSSLCFAVSNPNKKAQTTAMRVAGGIIKKWEGVA